jgi:hypothetical protein
MWHRYVTDLGNCHGWTRTSWIPVLSAAPSRTGLSCQGVRIVFALEVLML